MPAQTFRWCTSVLRRATVVFAVGAAVAALQSCRDSTGADEARALRLGIVSSGELAADRTLSYTLRLEPGQLVAIYFQSFSGKLKLEVFDPEGTLLDAVVDFENPGQLDRRFVALAPERAGTYRVTITSVDGAGAFRILPSALSLDPESADPVLAIGDTVSEWIEQRADIDEFTFTIPAGQQAILFVQKTDPGPGIVSAALLDGATGDPWPTTRPITVAAHTDDLESSAFGRFTSPDGREYTIVVWSGSVDSLEAAAGYRLQVRLIDRLPEGASPALAAGDTAFESIDHVGDLDEFSLTGEPGDEYNIFIGAVGAAPRLAVLELEIPDHRVFAAPDVPMLRNPTGRFVMPSSGRMRVLVRDDRDHGGLYRGPYRLHVHRVDRMPEGRSSAITLETGAITGAIDVPGDIDEFTITTSAPASVNLMLTRIAEGAIGSGVFAELERADDGQLVARARVDRTYLDTFEVGAIGRFSLPAGSYRLRADGSETGAGGFQGSYEVELYPLHWAPEHVEPALAIGDTLGGESIDRPGDPDTFVFSGTPDDTITVAVAIDPADPIQSVRLAVHRRDTGASVATTQLSGRGYRETGRMQLPVSGEYEVVVSTGGGHPAERGPYDLIIERVSARPEHGGAELSVGASVLGERIDLPGDVDVFVLRGAPGESFGVAFHWLTPNSGVMQFEIVDPATNEVILEQGSAGYLQYTGITTFPSGGVVVLKVAEPARKGPFCNPCIEYYGMTGPYTVTTFPLSRQPEVHGSHITIGDTIAGEAIDPTGDVDEFTFSTPVEQSVAVHFQRFPFPCCFGPLTLELVDPTSDAVLAAVSTAGGSAMLEDVSTGVVTLGAGRSYRIRVRGTDPRDGAAPYRFRIAAQQE